MSSASSAASVSSQRMTNLQSGLRVLAPVGGVHGKSYFGGGGAAVGYAVVTQSRRLASHVCQSASNASVWP